MCQTFQLRIQFNFWKIKPNRTSETLNSEGSVVCAPRVSERVAGAHERPVLPAGVQVGNPFPGASGRGSVAKPAVLVTHHCAHQPAVGGRAERTLAHLNFCGAKIKKKNYG